jgi:hypothetical protein
MTRHECDGYEIAPGGSKPEEDMVAQADARCPGYHVQTDSVMGILPPDLTPWDLEPEEMTGRTDPSPTHSRTGRKTMSP